jgi:hypothetical protein
MKKYEKRPRPDAAFGTRTGPRARAAQERKFSDPYARAERPSRPPRPGGFGRPEGEGARGPQPRAAVVTLDPDVARVFRGSEAVNEALRMVMRLARLAGGGPGYARENAGPRFADRRGPPRGDRPHERRGPPRPRTPRSDDE